MSINPRQLVVALTVASAIAGTVSCSDDSPPTQPTVCTPSLNGLALSPTSVGVGTTSQGTVTLSCAPTSATSVTLSSSDASASVPGTVTVPSGGATATFTITTNSPGTPTITASQGGVSRTATLTITAQPEPGTLASLILAGSSVTGGNSIQGTVTLSAVAPSGGSVVLLSSSDASVGAVPANVTVTAGTTTATFSVTTRAVGGTIPIVISASFGGVTRTANLSVTPITPTLAAIFSVRSNVNNAANTCQLSADGQSLNCTYDGSPSTPQGGLREWNWTWQLPTQSVSAPPQNSPTLSNPSTNGCGLFNDPSVVRTSGNPISMTVRLRVRDNNNTLSNETVNTNVQIIPTNGACGFNF